MSYDTYNMKLTYIIKDLVSVSDNIYEYVLSKKTKKNTYIISVGQSPAYYALSMMHNPNYNENLVKIIVLPYSSNLLASNQEEQMYNKYLRDNNLFFTSDDEIYFLDQIQRGTVITNFLNIIKNRNIIPNRYLITLNYDTEITKLVYSETPVVKQFSSMSLPILSDEFPRIVQDYSPDMFLTEPMKVGFIDLETNPYVPIIIKCSKMFPNSSF